MRLLPALLGLGLTGCATVAGPRTLLREEPVETRCVPAGPRAAVDPAVRERVRLLFVKTEQCTTAFDTTYQQEERTQLAQPVRWALAGTAGLIGIMPTVALLLTRPDIDLSGRKTTGSYNNAGEILAWVILAPGIALGWGVYHQTGKPQIVVGEVIERGVRTVTAQRAAGSGEVTGLAQGRALVEGALELSLEEAAGLPWAPLALDGVKVELDSAAIEKLAALGACREAIGDLTRPAQERWKKAETCDRNGWGFADAALIELGKTLEGARIKR